MSEAVERPPSVSSVSSVSLVEIAAETRLVLKAFLHQSLSLPLADRPGRVGGAYRDHTKYCVKPQPKAKDGLDSQDEDVSSADEKKNGLRDLIKRLPRPASMRHRVKDNIGASHTDSQPNGGTPESLHYKIQLEDDAMSPSSTSEEEDSERKQKKKEQGRKKLRKQISKLFRRKTDKDKDRNEPQPQRPSTLSFNKEAEPVPTVVSPNHSPEFYKEVAEKLGKIAQRSTSIKSPSSPARPPPACDKEVVVRQLVQVLSLEGDAINNKIQSDPFLRSKLTRLSYPSFAKLLDTFSNRVVDEAPALPPQASPTLRRVAVTMEVSRRIVTATGTQRMQGYAECYMETFAPWVKSHGGWENVVHLEEPLEYD
ncbi:apoptosis facilitator Bcl-2-like protein 14 isoform X2 [Myripristis murdjan]|uniref:BCL2 like 12 n=1 Tax=Myripristis murdjan TaxID=586833 RepID=A0A667Z246_9TELE|nr:bcl-2-like protein 12 isoform X2 [Myripristis murdjan]